MHVSTFTLTLRGHITCATQIQSAYMYVPFELPGPAERLHIRYTYWSDQFG